jgi:RNA polymerase sigma factor (TIGR02999 family)
LSFFAQIRCSAASVAALFPVNAQAGKEREAKWRESSDIFPRPIRKEGAAMSGGEVTRLLHGMANARSEGARRELYDRLVVMVYDDLRRAARRKLAGERADSVQATGLVHEAYARLVGYRMNFRDRSHFLRVAAAAMRRCLIERARALGAAKRGEGQPADTLTDVIAAVMPDDPARLLDVDRALASLTPEQAQFTELRYFAGFTLEETAEILGIKAETAKKRWRVIKLLLAHQLAEWGRRAQ